jgi:hypothetical protein
MQCKSPIVPYVERLKELIPEMNEVKFRYDKNPYGGGGYCPDNKTIIIPYDIITTYTQQRKMEEFEIELCFRELYGFNNDLLIYYLILHEFGHHLQYKYPNPNLNLDEDLEIDEKYSQLAVDRKISFTESWVRHKNLPSEKDASDFAEKFLKEHRELWEKNN